MPPKRSISRRARKPATGTDDAGNTAQAKPSDKTKAPEQPTCNAFSEKKVIRCGKPVAALGDFCKAHKFWDRRDHLRSGCQTDEDDLIWHDVCAKIGCNLEGPADGCEACPRLFHAECLDAFATIIKVSDVEDRLSTSERLICGPCHQDAELFTLLPASIRSPKLAQRHKGNEEAVEEFLHGDRAASKQGAGSAGPTDVEDGHTLIDLSTLSTSEIESILTKRRQAETPKGAAGGGQVLSDVIEQARKRALALSTTGFAHLYAHNDAACNDPSCPLNKRDGAFDVSGGDRLDGKFTHYLLLLLGPRCYRAYSIDQFPAIDAEIAERKCGKKDFETPTYSKHPLTDHQVVIHLDNQAVAHSDVCRANAARDPPIVCATRLDLIENLRALSAECKTMMLDPQAYPGVTAHAYIRAALHEAQRGRNITQDVVPGEPRTILLNSLLLRKVAGSTPGADTSASATSTPMKQAGADRCFNCRGHGTTGDHTANDCPLKTVIKCGAKLRDGSTCQLLHKRGDHK